MYDFATPHSNNREWVVSNGIGNIWIYKERWCGQLKLVLSLLITNVNASTHSYLQVLWQFQSAKLYCDDVIIHLCLSSFHPQMIVAKPP